VLHHLWVRIALAFVLLGLAIAASVTDGMARIGLSLTALAVLAAVSCGLPAQRALPHPALQGAICVVGGVCVVAVAFTVYLLFVLAGASTPVLIGVALMLMTLSALLATRFSSST